MTHPTHLRRCLALAAAALLLVTQPGVDCLSDDGGSDFDSSPRRDSSSSSSRLDSAVPDSAEPAGDFDPGDFRWTARSNGTAYVFDRDERKVVAAVRVRAGETVMVQTKDNRLWIDGGTEQKVGFSSDHRHRVFFDPDRRRSRTRDRDRDRDRDDGSDRSRDRSDARDRRDDYRDDRPTFDDRTLPRNAEQVRAARGSDLSYKADADGLVYLYDADAGRVVRKFTVRRGQRLTVDPNAGTATLDGRPVYNGSLGRRTRYRLYFVNPA